MNDQASDYQRHDHQPAAPHEHPTTDIAKSETTQFLRLPDPCSSAQLAAVLGKSPKTLVDWCQEREFTHIPCFRLGNRWYHRVPELVRWLNRIKSGQIEFHRRPRNSQTLAGTQPKSTPTTSGKKGP